MSLVSMLPCSLQPRQNLLQAAGLVGQTSGELLQQIGESDTDPRFQVSAPSSSQGHPLPKTISLCTGLTGGVQAEHSPVPGGDFVSEVTVTFPISVSRVI